MFMVNLFSSLKFQGSVAMVKQSGILVGSAIPMKKPPLYIVQEVVGVYCCRTVAQPVTKKEILLDL